MDEKDIFEENESELMEYYGLEGKTGRLNFKMKMFKSWFYH